MRTEREWTAQEPLLDPSDEVELARRIEAGLLAAEALETGSGPAGATKAELGVLVAEGQAARRRFVEANLGLVHMVVRSAVSRTGAAEADLIQEGCLGLLAAVARFDHRRGLRFATYALPWIRAYIGAATATMLGDLNLPVSRAAQLRTARGLEAGLSQRLGRTATVAEVAASLGRSERWTAELLAHEPPTALDSSFDELVLAGPSGSDDAERVEEVHLLLARLPVLQRQVIELRLGFETGQPLSLGAVARRLGIGAGRVRRLERTGLDELRARCPYEVGR